MTDPPFPAEQLLELFFHECEKKFRFLEQLHDMTYLSGLVEKKNHYKIIRPYINQAPKFPFQAVTRYESDQMALELRYGEESMITECYLFYGPINRFTLEEILYAGRKAPNKVFSDWGVTHEQSIKNYIQKTAEAVKAHHKLLIAPSEKHIERALTIKDKRLEQAVYKQYNKALQETARKAAKAYRQKNYRLVVSLLSPYEKHLPNAERKKLDLAKRQLLS